METEWQKAQEYEALWHERVSTNTYHEEEKQFIYAKKMGMEIYKNAHTPYNLKNYGKILDIGGGESSMLLKVESPVGCVVVDPLSYPQWVIDRYASKGIVFAQRKAEEHKVGDNWFDEVWIYNTLQHTENPELICENALHAGKLVRIFEWIETGTSEGHIRNLTEENLNKWLGGQGKVETLSEHGCCGKCFYGIFLGHIK